MSYVNKTIPEIFVHQKEILRMITDVEERSCVTSVFVNK